MLEVQNLFKKYGARVVLQGVSFTVKPGEIYGYVGGNGAGKTTSMRIMLGINKPDQGLVKVNGKELTDKVRASIGYMPEERGLYPKMTLRKQLVYFAILHGFSKEASRQAADFWLKKLGLEDRSNARLDSLSLGNQQKVQLAVALVHQPSVLILDEPFSGLDPQAVDIISEVLKIEANRGIPVIFSSHQLDLVERLCDKVGILRDGEIIAEGSVKELGSAVGNQIVIRTKVPKDVWSKELLPYASSPGETKYYEIQEEKIDQIRIKIFDNFDSQKILKAIVKHGAVEEFYKWQPSLHEIYNDVMNGSGIEE